ncbi:hypothetical protein HanXRQr2_Chr13g0568321 [Helianthus annuus]|uniref:Uncharacterized protein n=1 Tax=Helianthus annuus TaxID=4232 RepID=A0A9K3HAV7_HELAN|nr:hypothetical protein HanXRQr2_Chr13g0568321 [Helianthus annuus]
MILISYHYNIKRIKLHVLNVPLQHNMHVYGLFHTENTQNFTNTSNNLYFFFFFEQQQ